MKSGILITGGKKGTSESLSAVEIFIPDLNRSCSLQPMNHHKYLHSQNGFLSCGGFETPSLCEFYTPGGGWAEEHYKLTQERWGHTSWTLNNGSVLLLGGLGQSAQTTTDLVRPGLDTQPGFNLKYPSL